MSMNNVGTRRMTSNAISSCNDTVRVAKRFPPTPVHTDTETGIRDKRVQASETHGYGRQTQTGTGIRDKRKRASNKTGTDCTTAIGSCRECWLIPTNDTYVQVKSNKSAYKGVKLS